MIDKIAQMIQTDMTKMLKWQYKSDNAETNIQDHMMIIILLKMKINQGNYVA